MDSTTVIVALISIVVPLAGVLAKFAIDSRRLHLDVARQIGNLSEDVGRQNGRGPVTRMIEELLDRTDRIERRFDALQDRVSLLSAQADHADEDSAVLRKVVLDLVAARKPGGRRSTDPKGQK